VITYVRGEYVADTDAGISAYDRGFFCGDAVFDATRTFDGRPFRMEAHLERFRRSLRFIEIAPDPIIREVRDAVEGAVERSREEIAAVGDVLIFWYVTRGGAREAFLLPGYQPDPTVIVLLRPINFAAFATLYENGVDLSVSLTTRHFTGATDARVKSTNRLAAVRGELKDRRQALAEGRRPAEFRAWTIMFSDDGFVAEAHAANLCIVSDGCLVRPPRYELLEGVTLETVCELAATLGLSVEERRLKLYDLINADETYICTSSFQLLPVAAIDAIGLTHQTRNVYRQLLELYKDYVEFDFVGQAQSIAARSMEQTKTTAAHYATPVS
jgi:branched-chain amino acid aminotransferase